MTDFDSELTTWAATGEQYPSDYAYEDGETPVDEWDNYAMYHIIEEINEIFAYLNSIPDNVAGHGDIEDHRQNEVHTEPQQPQEHGNGKHEKDYITEGEVDVGAPSPHGNAHHDPAFAESDHGHDKYAEDSHGNEAHTEDFSVDGDKQPPEKHGNGAHEEEFVSEPLADKGTSLANISEQYTTEGYKWGVKDTNDLSGVELRQERNTGSVNVLARFGYSLSHPAPDVANSWLTYIKTGIDIDGNYVGTGPYDTDIHLIPNGGVVNIDGVAKADTFTSGNFSIAESDGVELFVESDGERIAELDSDGNLKISGTIEENANL